DLAFKDRVTLNSQVTSDRQIGKTQISGKGLITGNRLVAIEFYLARGRNQIMHEAAIADVEISNTSSRHGTDAGGELTCSDLIRTGTCCRRARAGNAPL